MKETIVLKCYDLLKYSIPLTENFKRNIKFSVGDRIVTQLGDLLELCVEAYYSPVPAKRLLIPNIQLKLHKLRYFFRLAHELGEYNSARLKDIHTKIDEIGRMAHGWLKSLPKENSL